MFTIPADSLETPALLIDLCAIDRNIQTMQRFLIGKKATLRPHFKTVKITSLTKMQIEAGAKGATCAKLGEAEALVDAGIQNVLIANQIVWPSKIQRLAELCARARMCVAVDSLENAKDLSNACKKAGTTLHCLVEIDSGAHRCGVRNVEDGVALAKQIHSLDNLVFEGIQAYDAHIMLKEDEQVRRDGTSESLKIVRAFRDALLSDGLPVHEISGGGTGTYAYTGDNDVFTELQAGSYLYMDARYKKLGLPFEHAQYVLATVMSKHPGVAFADAGLKVFGMDNGNPVPVGFEDYTIKLNEEHCRIEDPKDEFKVGQQIAFIPGHCCTTVNLYDRAYGVRNGVVERIFAVDGRGRSV